MRLVQLRICGFQSFGPVPQTIRLEALTYVLGPNGSGKTAVLQALVRMFGVDPSQRRIQPSDFHIPAPSAADDAGSEPDTDRYGDGDSDGDTDVHTDALNEDADQQLWLETDFEIPEAGDESGDVHPSVPAFYGHMQLERNDEVPRLRVRLTATLDPHGYVDEKIVCVTEVDKDDEPRVSVELQRNDRNTIQVHYLPARRDPADHISYAAASLLGRALRAADWRTEREAVAKLTAKITEALAANDAVESIGKSLQESWAGLHRGTYFRTPKVSFGRDEIENLLRHLTVTFFPSPDKQPVDFARLSDGQKSLLYISLVLTLQSIGRDVQTGKSPAFDVDKLRPAAFT
ncbi:MAG: ATP-dependent endonuclease, partial [Comamonadaceae bacterium]